MLKPQAIVLSSIRSQQPVTCAVLLLLWLSACVPVGVPSPARLAGVTFTPDPVPAASDTLVPPTHTPVPGATRTPRASAQSPARTLSPGARPPVNVKTNTATPRPTPERAQAVPSATTAGTRTARPTNTPGPSNTPQPTATLAPSDTPGPTDTLPAPTDAPPPAPTDTPVPPTQAPPPVAGHPYDRPVVIANMFPWYDEGTWSRGCTSAGDTPSDGVYNSDDDGVIQRQIAQAQSAGIDGFAVHFYAPGNRTDTNFQKVLAYSGGGFHSAVTFLTHILPGETLGGVRDSLSYVIGLSGNGSYLRYNGKPVILFSDMQRIPDDGGGRTGDDGVALERWRAVRDAVDPGHATI
jgi:hypothetical protein